MRKLLRGIVDFRTGLTPERRERLARLALGQSPDAMLICCSDSRVAPNVFASTEPGDLFVVRNPGNLIAPCDSDGRSVHDEAEAAAIEFATLALGVRDIVICGHSSCGAMLALFQGNVIDGAAHLATWIRHGEPALAQLRAGAALAPELPPQDQLSQLNVLAQLMHLRSYRVVREREEAGRLNLHGWWYDIARAEVSAFEPELRRFVPIDEEVASRILARLAHGS